MPLSLQTRDTREPGLIRILQQYIADLEGLIRGAVGEALNEVHEWSMTQVVGLWIPGSKVKWDTTSGRVIRKILNAAWHSH